MEWKKMEWKKLICILYTNKLYKIQQRMDELKILHEPKTLHEIINNSKPINPPRPIDPIKQILKLVSLSKTIDRDPELGLFTKKRDILPFHPSTVLEQCDGLQLKTKIRDILNNIESLRTEYDEERDQWYIDFGTKPILKTIEPSDKGLIKIIKIKQWAAIQVAQLALKKSQYLRTTLEEMYYYHEERKWFNAVISVCYNNKDNKCIVDYVHINGDTFSFYVIKNIIAKQL